MHERARNAPILMELAAADLALCPTRFQASLFPLALRPLIHVAADGVDMALYRPDPSRRKAGWGPVPAGVPLISYATRGMEPHRGFDLFMAALPRILAASPTAQVVIAGQNRVFYGGDAFRAVDWKARALQAHPVDPTRVHFTGPLAPADYLQLLQRTDAHIYLTVPFVLSWSMLEAMSTGCPLILSDTAPVRDFADARSACLVEMEPAAIAEAVLLTLDQRADSLARGQSARDRIAETADQAILFPERAALLQDLIGRRG